MNKWLAWLAAGLVLAVGGSYAWTHRRHVRVVAMPTLPVTQPAGDAPPSYEEARQAQQLVTVAGPLADYMTNRKPERVETLETSAYRPTAADRVGESPVGTSRDILHKTFSVAGVVNLPFELPAHAANPQLRGSYRSFVGQTGVGQTGNPAGAAAGVEFLVLNQQQYADFLNGRPDDALFSAEDAHAQDVNFSMPPTFNEPAKYYLVFRNSGSVGKKTVEADFRIDF
jgi:hypothetical protein